MKDKQKKILVTMSGGVDSSVAAALLVGDGYDVTGAYMVNYDEDDGLSECWRADYRDAVRVAAHLGIKLIRLNFVNEYKSSVLDYMYAEYEKGRTPNPDVLCNKFVKFDAWVAKAKKLDFEALATGHYARKIVENDHLALGIAKDENKDQTYFLHQLDQEQLEYAMFPLGDYTKDEVRALAHEFDLPTAEKEESMGICFVGEVPMTEFLQQKIEKKPGNIVHGETGEVLGQHDGLSFYTIGQRSLGVSSVEKEGETKPLYVVAKDQDKNALIVGDSEDERLYTEEVEVEDMHWIGNTPDFPFECEVRLRHRQELHACSVDESKITFKDRQRAVTSGQFAVLYKEGVCLGGGAIV